jgi:sortase A
VSQVRVYSELVGTGDTAVPMKQRSSLRLRLLRSFGTALIAVGALALVWAFVVWRWNDPFTGLYTRLQQGHLRAAYQRLDATYQPVVPPRHSSVAREEEIVSQEAQRYRRNAVVGKPIGRIAVPRLGLRMILVNGTDHDTLTSGPGRDPRTFMPGERELVYIAGHRTTYLAPFAHIDALRRGDPVTLAMPYGTFVYSVTGHVIVDAHDLSVLRSHHRDVLALQACHPRFFATQRYIVWATLVEVRPRQGPAYVPTAVRRSSARTAS